MTVLSVLAVLVGLLLLWRAADLLVDGATQAATRVHIPPVIVGAVVIGAGTSAPEAFVSGLAAYQDSLGVAVGNVVGSNTANLSLVLGIAALVAPLSASRQVLRVHLPLAVAATVAVGVVVQGGLSLVEGVVLLAVLAVLVTLVVVRGRDDSHPADQGPTPGIRGSRIGPARLLPPVLRTVVGLVGVVAGAQLLVQGAVDIAGDLGLSEGFVGLTIVAIGTSLPELITAVAAARKGQSELLLGNVFGSNVANSLGVAGIAGVVGPASLDDPGLLVVGVLSMVAVTVLAAIFLFTSRRLSRREGVVLLVVWLGLLPFSA